MDTMVGCCDLAVRCRDVSKAYGTGATKVIALGGVDLDVRRGEMLLLVGPSGSGKTTLISIIAGILDWDSGTCSVLGQDLRRMDEGQRALFRRRALGFVFQSFNLLPALTAAENAAVPLLIDGMPWSLALARAREVLEKVGLGARPDALPAQLSGGQQQRVAIARALVHDPKLIICDEPTSSLDHKTGHDMMEMMRGLGRSPDRALIVVTHDTRLLDFGDRIAQMEDGKILGVLDAPRTKPQS